MEAVLEKPKNKNKKKKKVLKVEQPPEDVPKECDEKPADSNVTYFTSSQSELPIGDEAKPDTWSLAERPLELSFHAVNNDTIKEIICENSTLDVQRSDELSSSEVSGNGSKVSENLSKTKFNVPSSDQLLKTNIELLNSMKIAEAVNQIDLNLKSSKENKIPKIRAYTESQLAALYTNSELEAVVQFSNQFVEAELGAYATKRHPLYGLLENYLQARNKITGNNLEFEQLRKDYKKIVDLMWTLESATASRHGTCNDGIVVTASQVYRKPIYHLSSFQSMERILNSLRKVTKETHVLYSYLAEVSKLQIELYLQTLTYNCITGAQLGKHSAVALVMHEVPPHISMVLSDLRLCISVLFSYQRRLIKDNVFIKETREWLNPLIAILLRVANWQDHLFILHHVLRCPGGVGTWAAPYIQLPLPDIPQESPFSSYKINHIMTVLAVLLMPVEKRDRFLEQFGIRGETAEEALWVLVDSEGEEDEDVSGTPLKENDLVQLLNQIPLDDLFRSTILIHRQNGHDKYDPTQITEHHLLRFISFSTTLLKTLYSGLQTYDSDRYHQFSKRLCRFVKHVVEFVTDQWEHFEKDRNCQDKAMLERLQVEYDAFLLRAAYGLYNGRKSGAWQFLVGLPYHLVTSETLKRIFYLLHYDEDYMTVENFDKKLWDSVFRAYFEDHLSKLEEGESCYLLNAYSNMALARNLNDLDFIEVATADLLRIGFISELTQDNCSKNVRILLSHITSRYPQLLSDILREVKSHFSEIQSLSLYLYEDLPLSIWIPSDTDMEIIVSWLTQYPINSDESRLARMIISRLNWRLNDDDQSLFLPHKFHVQVAMLLAQIVELDSGYLPWAWQTAFRLRLHYSDRAFTGLNLPDLLDLTVICKGVKERKTFSCFLGLLLSSSGHLVPVILSNGLNLLENIVNCQKNEAALFALQLILPLFVDSQESLVNNEKFQTILSHLINADRTYINLAKSLVFTFNEVVKQFGNMLDYQIENFRLFNFECSKYLARLWISALVSVPNWNRDSGVLHLLDVIIRASFFNSPALNSITDVMKELLQISTPQESNLSISSLFKWASQSTSPQGSLFTASSLPSCIWLAYLLISLEFEEREKQTGLWKEILNQLKNQKGKVNVDFAIKKAASVVKVPSFTSSSLCIYRWAQQALDTPIDHPILPLLWQNFFILYLARTPVASSVDIGCLGEKFFEGIINLSFFKKLKKRLQETTEFYQNKCSETNNEEEDDIFDENARKIANNRKLLAQNRLRVFRAFSLWLEEPRLREANLYLPHLPAIYEPQLLSLIIQGNNSPWYEFVDYDTVKEEQLEAIKCWKMCIYREKSNSNLPRHIILRKESADPIERILNRLKSYDVPKPAPLIVKTAPIIPVIDLNNTKSLISDLQSQFKLMQQFAHNYSFSVSEHKILDATYKELIPQQYRSVMCKVVKKVSCKGRGEVACSGSAIIQLEMQEAKLNENIEHQIQVNRNNYEYILSQSLQIPARNLCLAAVTIQKTIEMLEVQVRCNNVSADLGVELFYHILTLLNDETNTYPPTHQFFAFCLNKLGESFICGNEFETPRLLNKILESSELIEVLVPHFLPVNVGTTNFLHMYLTISNVIGQRYSVIFSLLSKFDIPTWLDRKRPQINQRVDFIKLVIKGLTLLTYNPPAESKSLHELYRNHLLCIFEYQFPEHYKNVLSALLIASNGTDTVSIEVWLDMLNSISKPVNFTLGSQHCVGLRQFAQTQRKLSYNDLFETAGYLAKHFAQERVTYGLYGLYPKYKNYVEVFILFGGMIGHALVVTSLTTYQGLAGEKICEIIWPILRELFAPWIMPYSTQNIKDNMTSWMQNLTDDRSVLLPWIIADGPHAQKAMNMLFDCVQFMNQIIPGSNSIMSLIWQWYVTFFAHPCIKEHILNVVHGAFLSLPWQNFWPTLYDLDLMMKVIDQYLTESHVFLGHIFIQIPWIQWLPHVSYNADVAVSQRIHHRLLHLLVKLAKEPNIRQNHCDTMKSLLAQAESFNWAILEPEMYQQVIDWLAMSCDPKVVCISDPMNLDYRILNLMRVAAHYHIRVDSINSSFLKTRYLYFRCYVLLIFMLAQKSANLTSIVNVKQLSDSISANLDHLEAVVSSEEEFVSFLKEIFRLLSFESIRKECCKCFEWFNVKASDGFVLRAVLQSLETVPHNDYAATLYEMAVNSYFYNGSQENYNDNPWQTLVELTKMPSEIAGLEKALFDQASILTMNIMIYQKIKRGINSAVLMNTVLHWLNNIKLEPSNEDKLPLLWAQLLKLATSNCDGNELEIASILYKFSQYLLQICNDKGSSGWGKGFLGALGLVKQDIVSLKFRFLCRSLAGYVLAQLYDAKKGPRKIRNVPNAPGAVGCSGGNTECAKVLLGLDFGQSQGDIKNNAELALKEIQNPVNSLHNACTFLATFVTQMYTKPYLKDIDK